jgi:hypothetical protein
MLRIAIMTAAVLACFAMPAAAGETADEIKAACAREHTDRAGADACAVQRMNAEADRVNQLAAQIEQQTETIRRNNQCASFILDGIEAQRFSRERVLAAYGGSVTSDVFIARSCEVAPTLGY